MRLICVTLLLLGGALCSAQDASSGASVVSGAEAAAAMDSLTPGNANDTADERPRIPTQEEVSINRGEPSSACLNS